MDVIQQQGNPEIVKSSASETCNRAFATAVVRVLIARAAPLMALCGSGLQQVAHTPATVVV